jgi:Protein phosphatase 1 inhibitor
MLGLYAIFFCDRIYKKEIHHFLHICRSNKYLYDLEMNFITPECHLCLVGCRLGILGRPKYLYDTMLNLNEAALRKMNWNEEYDPYGVISRVFINIYTSDDFTERYRVFVLHFVTFSTQQLGVRRLFIFIFFLQEKKASTAA